MPLTFWEKYGIKKVEEYGPTPRKNPSSRYFSGQV